jgi:hypothetical protein
MKQLRSFGAIVMAAALVLIGLGMPGSTAAGAGEIPAVPEKIAVPAGSTLLFGRHARGVQIYECVGGQWALHAPRAQLFNPQSYERNGIHYGGIDRGLPAGPWWESTEDGSRIRGAKVDEAPSPNPDSIVQLLLKVVERQGSGEFIPATHIQRLNTVGGVGPTGACETRARREVPYTADYYFYAAP